MSAIAQLDAVLKPSAPPAPPKKPFTPLMKDRQARSKDPGRRNNGSDDDNDEDDEDLQPAAKKPARTSSATGSTTHAQNEAWELAEKRRTASVILGSSELLMMYALSRGDSVPGTRQHFTKILCGYEDVPPEGEDKK